MTGPIGAAAALACLLGLAACGGGGAAGGGPTPPPPEPFFLEQGAARVAAIDTAIAGHTHVAEAFGGNISSNRLADSMNYAGVTTGDAAPGIDLVTLSPLQVVRPLKRDPLGDGVWLFTDTYTQGEGDAATEYRDIVLFSYDATFTGDNDGHYWGVWMRQPTETGLWDGINPFNRRGVTTAAIQEIQATREGLSILVPTATYKGGALGVYTKGGTRAGWFSADASMTANFNSDSIDAADRLTLSGTISNFVLSGQEENDWRVALSGGLPKTNTSPGDSYWTGTADGGGTSAGAFIATMYGAPVPPATLQTPSWVTGTFSAQFSDGNAIGAFNGQRDE